VNSYLRFQSVDGPNALIYPIT